MATLRLPLILVAIWACPCCGSSPMAGPSPGPLGGPLPFQNLTGIWQVSYEGSYSSGCRTPARGGTTVFRLSQKDALVTGSIFNVDVSGTQTPDATSVQLNGSITQFGLRSMVQATIVPEKNLSSFTGTLNATLAVESVRGIPSCGTRIYGQIIDAHRVPFDTSTSSFAGVWTGRFGVDDCSFVGWTYCYPVQKGDTAHFRLELNQVGSSVRASSVSGALELVNGYDIPVKGTVSGGRLVLEGSLTRIVSGGQHVVRLTEWSTTRDDLGRMTGSFSYIDEYVKSAGGTNSTTSHNVLVGVTLTPQ